MSLLIIAIMTLSITTCSTGTSLLIDLEEYDNNNQMESLSKTNAVSGLENKKSDSYTLTPSSPMARIGSTITLSVGEENNSNISIASVKWTTTAGTIVGSGLHATYTPPSTKGMVQIVAEITTTSSEKITKKVNIDVFKQYVMMRFDDIILLEGGLGQQGFLDVLALAKSKNMPVNFGLICNSIAGTNKAAAYAWIREESLAGNVEFWFHGWDHKIYTPTGKVEFLNDYTYQKNHFDWSLKAYTEKTGLVFRAFSAPTLADDTTTERVMRENPEIVMWLHPKSTTTHSTAMVHRNTYFFESETGVCTNYNRFLSGYQTWKSASSVTFACHPGVNPNPSKPAVGPYTNGSANLAVFTQMVDFLISEDVTFILPYEYYKLVKGWKL